MPPESLGVTLGAQVVHLVTYRDPSEGALIYTIFTKKCQKRSKKGVPLFLTIFELAPPRGVHARRLVEVENVLPF